MSKHRAILIAGPTASGKSAAAIAIAQRLGGVVVNADSMQVYRDLRVLTARPGVEDEQRVPHRLYGHVDAGDRYSVGRWLEDVSGAIAQADETGRIPVIAGGTGLYFKALVEGLSPVPDIPGDVRTRWRNAASQMDARGLHDVLKRRDPKMADRLRPSDSQRVVRALEVIDATDQSLADWQDRPGEPVLAETDVMKIRISPPRDVLYDRINRRFDAMLEDGALEEVRALGSRGLDRGLPAMRAIGLRPLLSHLDGELTLEAAIEQAKTETRRYAKRQDTWAKSNMISWNDVYEKEMESLMSAIFSFIDV